MSLAFKQVKVYTKLSLFLIVAVAVGAVLIKNRDHTVQVWFFGLIDPQQRINVIWLMLCTAASAVIFWWVFGTGLGLVRDVRELRRQEEARQSVRAQEELAAKLREQERRIDEKINKAIAEEPSSDK